MDLADDMPTAVAKEMPSPQEIAACRWLPDDELAVYAGEYRREGFQGGLNWYRPARRRRALGAAGAADSGQRATAGFPEGTGDPDLRDALHLVLDDEYDLIEAVNGARALATLASMKIDLILLDVVSPSAYLQGFSCLHALMRNVWPMSPPSHPEKGQSLIILGFTTTSMYTSKSGMTSKFSNL